MSDEKRGIFFVFLAACLWGVGGFFSKMGVTLVGPWIAAFLRSLCFFPVVMGFVLSSKKFNFSFERKALYPITAGILVGLGIILVRLSLSFYEVSLVTPIQRLSILVTVILSFIILREELTPGKSLGIVLALTSFLLLSPLSSGPIKMNVRLCYLGGIIFSLGSSTVLLRLSILKKGVNYARFFRVLFQTVFVFLGVFLYLGSSVLSIPRNIGLLYSAVNGICGGCAFILFCKGLKTVDTSVAKSFMVVATIISTALGVLLLGESCTLKKMIGISLAIVAVLLLSKKY